MARLGSETLKASVNYQGEEVIFSLRQPTNEEMNRFLASRYEVGRRGQMKDHGHEARCRLFDKLFVGVENLEAPDGGPITAGNLSLVPATWKAGMVFELFEAAEIEVKNS